MDTTYVIIVGALTACAAAGVLVAIKRPRYIAGTVAIVLLVAAACIIIPDLLRIYETNRRILVILVAAMVVAGLCVFLWYGGELLSKFIIKHVPPPGPYSKLRRRRMTDAPDRAPEAPPVSAVELEEAELPVTAVPEPPAGAPERVTVRPAVTAAEAEQAAPSAQDRKVSAPHLAPVRLDMAEAEEPPTVKQGDAEPTAPKAKPPRVRRVAKRRQEAEQSVSEAPQPIPDGESQPAARPSAPQLTPVRLDMAEAEDAPAAEQSDAEPTAPQAKRPRTKRVAKSRPETEPVIEASETPEPMPAEETEPAVKPPEIVRVGKSKLAPDAELPEYGYEVKPDKKPRRSKKTPDDK